MLEEKDKMMNEDTIIARDELSEDTSEETDETIGEGMIIVREELSEEEMDRALKEELKLAISVICKCLCICLVAFLLLIGVLGYYHCWMITTIAECESPDGEYTLVVQQIGHPLLAEAVTYKVVLKKGKEVIDEKHFHYSSIGSWDSLGDDVTWGDENVTVLCYDGSELTINYD